MIKMNEDNRNKQIKFERNLITFPYLVRILGIEKYGLLMFAQAFMAYFSLIADYGFNLSGTREVSLNRNNIVKLSRIYNSILSTRIGLTILGFIIMALIVFSIDKFSKVRISNQV